jgi:hypothetical protein
LGLALSQVPQPVAVATLKNRMLNPSAQLFIDCAREVAKPLAKVRPHGPAKPRAKP